MGTPDKDSKRKEKQMKKKKEIRQKQ